MINIKRCQYNKCTNDALYGILNKRAQFCNNHKQTHMINVILERKCNILNCQKEYDFIVDNTKYCLEHHPDKNANIVLKKKCKYCDIEETSIYICNDCKKISNKKE
jgi:hypothetical protein